jgi:hypothetical protein
MNQLRVSLCRRRTQEGHSAWGDAPFGLCYHHGTLVTQSVEPPNFKRLHPYHGPGWTRTTDVRHGIFATADGGRSWTVAPPPHGGRGAGLPCNDDVVNGADGLLTQSSPSITRRSAVVVGARAPASAAPRSGAGWPGTLKEAPHVPHAGPVHPGLSRLRGTCALTSACLQSALDLFTDRFHFLKKQSVVEHCRRLGGPHLPQCPRRVRPD